MRHLGSNCSRQEKRIPGGHGGLLSVPARLRRSPETPCPWLALPSPPASRPAPPPPRRETSRAPRLLGNTATSAREVRARDCLSPAQAELQSFLISGRPICTPPRFLQGRLPRQTQSPSPPGCPDEAKETFGITELGLSLSLLTRGRGGRRVLELDHCLSRPPTQVKAASLHDLGQLSLSASFSFYKAEIKIPSVLLTCLFNSQVCMEMVCKKTCMFQ